MGLVSYVGHRRIYVDDLKVFAHNPKKMEIIGRLLKGLAKTYVWTLLLTNAQWSIPNVVLSLNQLVLQEPT